MGRNQKAPTLSFSKIYRQISCHIYGIFGLKKEDSEFLSPNISENQKTGCIPSWELRPVFFCLSAILYPQAGDCMVIYGDMVFFLNLLVNYTLLHGTARLGGSAPRRFRLWLGAAIGALYSVAVFLPGLYWMNMICCKILIAALMLLSAFGWKRSTLRLGAVFAVLSLVLCGAVYGFACVGKRPIPSGGHLLYPVSFGTLLLTAFAVTLACRLLLPPLTHSTNSILPLTLERDGKKIVLTALRDSGNTLRDPLSGGEVLTVYWKALRPILPPTINEGSLADPARLLPEIRPLSPRLIPYRAVGTENGILLAIPMKILIGKESRTGLVALSPTPVSDGGAYDALTGGHSYA